MKKLILMGAVAIFSLGASAQNVKDLDFGRAAAANLTKEVKDVVKLNANKDVYKHIAKKPATRIDGQPDGIAKDYFLIGNCDVSNIGALRKVVKQTLVFSEDGKTVYLPLMMYDTTSALAEDGGVYIPCTFAQIPDENGQPIEGVKAIVVPNDYQVGVSQSGTGLQTSLVINNMDSNVDNGGQPLDYEGILYYDEATGMIMSLDYQDETTGQPVYQVFGLYEVSGSGLYTPVSQFGYGITYYPVNDTFFDLPAVTRTVTYNTDNNGPQTKTVTEYQMNYDSGSGVIKSHFINGMFNDYANSWALLMPTTSFDAIDYGMIAQYKDETTALIYGEPTSDGNVSIDLNSYTTFLYDEITGGYNQTEGEYMFELGYDTNGHQVVVMEGYSNMVLGAATPVGINNVTTSTDKEAVATEYYDLSGRRVSAAEKGVTIKVEKYADGTSKATKVMK